MKSSQTITILSQTIVIPKAWEQRGQIWLEVDAGIRSPEDSLLAGCHRYDARPRLWGEYTSEG
jgi:hypothetical protein